MDLTAEKEKAFNRSLYGEDDSDEIIIILLCSHIFGTQSIPQME